MKVKLKKDFDRKLGFLTFGHFFDKIGFLVVGLSGLEPP